MSYAKLIHDYLDQGVSKAEEEALFSQMSNDPGIRDEFNRQMRIHLIAKEDMATITPPAECAANIFAAIGLNAPTDKKRPAFIPAFFYKAVIPVVVAALSSVTSIVVWNSFHNSSSDNSTNIENSKNGLSSKFNSSDKNNSNATGKVASVSSFADDENSNSNAAKAKTNDNSLSANNTNDKLTASNKSSRVSNGSGNHKGLGLTKTSYGIRDKASSNSTDKANSLSSNNQATNDLAANEALTSDVHNSSASNNAEFISISGADIKVTNVYETFGLRSNSSKLLGPSIVLNGGFDGSDLQLNGLNSKYESNNYIFVLNRYYYKNFPDKSALNTTQDVYENLAVTGLYRIDKGNMIGVELSWERFGQEFKVKGAAGEYVQSQFPMRLVVSGAYRYEAEPIISGISPYGQLNIGATNIGPVFKLGLGAAIPVNQAIELHLDANASTLLYNVNGSFYSSDKLGFSAGFSYGFK